MNELILYYDGDEILRTTSYSKLMKVLLGHKADFEQDMLDHPEYYDPNATWEYYYKDLYELYQKVDLPNV